MSADSSLSHQSLYRTYRPTTFAEVVGQDQITHSLAEQIASKKLNHAYLFAGSRGLGKTSIARIFARELGCTERDLYEIDAASNNSVDDIRALSENVYTLPYESPYKVYILDEAHMLSKGAWNAFLKTLEEPPTYVIFILATTELSKVPETVQSRCQVFEFKKPSRAVLANIITEIAEKESRTLDNGVADLIALLGDGSYRDALSVLGKVLVSGAQKKISLEDAEKVTGAPKHALVEDFVEALANGDSDKALRVLRKTELEGVDMNLYLSLVLELVRTVLLVRFAPELQKEIAQELGADSYAEIEKLATASDSKLTHSTLSLLLSAVEQMRFSPSPSLPLELVVLKLEESK